jgi:hypothetical protein
VKEVGRSAEARSFEKKALKRKSQSTGKRASLVQEEGNKAQKKQHGVEVGSSRGSVGEATNLKKKCAKCPYNRQRIRCKEYGGSGICEHNRE